MAERGWWGVAGVGALAGIAYVLIDGALLRETLWIGTLVLTCVGMGVGLHLHRPSRTHPWTILLSAFVLLTASYLLRFPAWAGDGTTMIGNLLTLAAYPMIAVAALTMVRVQAPGGDREGAIDGTIVMIAMATLLAGTVFNPSQLAADAATLDHLLMIVAPLLLSAVAAATFRILFVGSAHVPSAWLIVTAAICALLGNVARTVMLSHGTYTRGMWIDLLLLSSYLGVALATLHPSMVHLTEPSEPGRRRLTSARLVVLGVSLIAAPATLVIQEPGVGTSMPILSSVVLSLLVLWRLGRLVVERESARRALQERAERLDALAAIGLHALGDPDLEMLHEEVVRCCVRMLRLRTCDVGPVPMPTPSGAIVLPVDAASGDVLLADRDEPWDDEDVTFLQAVVNVLTGAHERHANQEAIRHRAVHDSLTGLPNRVLLLDRIEHALARGRRTGDTVGILFIDLDGFKQVNDDHGHQAGDDLLKLVARRLQTQVRGEDTLGRLAGDEFVVVCDRIDGEAARAVADRIMDALTTPFDLPCGPVRVSASIGLALAHEDAADPERLLGDADLAMYLAKEEPGSAVVVFDKEVGARRERRRRLERDLARAIERDELHLVYQPLIASPEHEDGPGRMVGVEALLRWTHPELGSVSPLEFIPIADATGLIGPVGDWVIREASAQLARWVRTLPAADLFTVWVNLSTRQLLDPALPERVRACLEDLGVAPQRFGFEVTETAMLGEETLPTLAALRTLGIQLALDDFGTGFSSLTHLKQLSLDLIKIDGMFVGGVTEDGEDRAIVRAVTAIARELGVSVIGEGVESAAQLSALRDLGCHLAQGYYLGRPVPAPEVPVGVSLGSRTPA